jgi:predicted Rossmann fold flavoprotein
LTFDSSPAAETVDVLDVLIVGAGAAGLATAIFTKRSNPERTVFLLDGARRPGAKILVSGGSRCNVTNTIVTAADFNGGRSTIVKKILRRFPVEDTIEFFAGLGVSLHEEPGGKLFPDSNRSRDVLDALLHEADARGVLLRPDHRVTRVVKAAGHFTVDTNRGAFRSSRVVFACGGMSLPKSGSDGVGYSLATSLGHTIVPTTPALVPLLLDSAAPLAIHTALSGVSQAVLLELWTEGRLARRIGGPMLWTHFGVSGPAALDLSRHWLRARLEGREARITANLLPDHTYESLERGWTLQSREQPRSTVGMLLARAMPASTAAAILCCLGLDGRTVLADLPRADRRRLVAHLVAWPLPVSDSRGYNYAEVTAGGVALTEIEPATMASRACPGLYLVGEILDVDGRLGGFNFQWAWATGYVAGAALGAASA